MRARKLGAQPMEDHIANQYDLPLAVHRAYILVDLSAAHLFLRRDSRKLTLCGDMYFMNYVWDLPTIR